MVGMWHLGTVTAACLASVGHTVIGIDEDPEIVKALTQAVPPVAEPGLAEMIGRECESGRLRFSTRFEDVAECPVVWIAYDTPVDENDVADVELIYQRSLRVSSTLAMALCLWSVPKCLRDRLHGWSANSRHMQPAVVSGLPARRRTCV